jgi:hypothetical protein
MSIRGRRPDLIFLAQFTWAGDWMRPLQLHHPTLYHPPLYHPPLYYPPLNHQPLYHPPLYHFTTSPLYQLANLGRLKKTPTKKTVKRTKKMKKKCLFTVIYGCVSPFILCAPRTLLPLSFHFFIKFAAQLDTHSKDS